MPKRRPPTARELAILNVLWDRGEATVREVYERIGPRLGIVQNTVQAFLRTMEEKGLVTHREEGRSFVYRAAVPREATGRTLLTGLLDRVFDGAMDQLVASALALRRPTREELTRLRRLIAQAEKEAKQDGKG
ncbi:MAG TPA: BlaI/MecI/CopY family transcriptional regulator [Planctomycetota bacterium]|nr:BlaI/MecI/CopY family transcriptional regulator [Planctomycetota bacterium]